MTRSHVFRLDWLAQQLGRPLSKPFRAQPEKRFLQSRKEFSAMYMLRPVTPGVRARYNIAFAADEARLIGTPDAISQFRSYGAGL